MYMQNDTGRDIANAIGDITFDTSGLAKDTTLQNTNAALGDINTTLQGMTTNDPPTDTTQQSIASAISGLGQTLGSDRALIDGSNIANPSAFRIAIGLAGSIEVITGSGTTGSTGNLSLNTSVNTNFIVGAACTSHNDIYLRLWRASNSNSWFITAVNPNTGATINNTAISFKYLLIKID